MKSDYIEPNDDVFNAQMQTYKSGIPGYAVILGVTAEQMAIQAADALYFDYVVKCNKTMGQGALQWTGWKNLTRNGGTPPPAGAPVPPVFPTTVPAVAPGIENRFRMLVQQNKKSSGYNDTIGKALDIEGTQQTGPDYPTVQPLIEVYVTGNHVFVKWTWGGYAAWLDMCELQVDRNDGKGFVPLYFDTTPGYTDPQPFPLIPTVWTYRAIYRVGENQVGLWSNPVSITVPA